MSDHAPRLVYVDDGVPETGTRLLEESCRKEGVAFSPLDPREVELHPLVRLEAGDLLYRPATSFAARLVEQHLYAPGVATFYADPAGPLFIPANPARLFQSRGLPMPQSVPCVSAERGALERAARLVGGFPVILKHTGFSGGVGVVRVDSLPVLHALVELALATGRYPVLMAYVSDAVHWRLVVVGNEVAGSYRNRTPEGEFRSNASSDPEDYLAPPPPGSAELARAAVQALRLEMGGVDILHHEATDRLYLLECNFPCYYAQAQSVIGVDTSGAMVRHLLAKARALDTRTS